MQEDWIKPKFARKIAGYKRAAFYNALNKKDSSGNYLIPQKRIDIPGEPERILVHLPSLIKYMEVADIPRLKKEAAPWISQAKHQEKEVEAYKNRKRGF
jgi:hypothetical protein